MKLLNSQKNQLYKIIESNEFFKPNQFEIEEFKNENNWNTFIEFNSIYFFKIFENSDYYNSCYVNYSPGDNKFLEVTDHVSFEMIKVHFLKWLSFLQQEISEPNLWDSFKSEISKFSESAIYDNSKFTAKEHKELESKMANLLDNISYIPLLIEQQNEIKSELKRITELSIDLGKFDWTNLLIGTLISIIIQLQVTPENARLIFDHVKSLFSNFLLK